MSKESLNEKHLDYLFQKPAFVNALKNLVRKISSKIKNEDVEQLVNDVYVKVKSRIYSKGGLNLEEDTVEKMAAYCKKTVERLAIDLVRSSRYSREVFTTDTGWEGGHVTGDEVSTEDVAARGWGSRPSSLDDRVLLSETERMFDSPEKELGNRKDKGELRRLLDQYGGMNEVNPTSPDSATFIDVAKERIKEESGLDWDLEMMKAKEDPNPMSRKHRIDALEDMLATKTNTLGRKTMRGWDTLNEWADKTDFSKNSEFNMMRELVKVATRLDSFGLTKEADVVDALIRKIATDDNEDEDEWDSLSEEEKTRRANHAYDLEDLLLRDRIFNDNAVANSHNSSPKQFSDFDWDGDPAEWHDEQWVAWDNMVEKVSSSR